ncbi:MAG: hypothetical protein OQJ84_11165 [Xanthomonadales bacterium]|nr:hypothetical protein [Xanthomonadales bacterium]
MPGFNRVKERQGFNRYARYVLVVICAYSCLLVFTGSAYAATLGMVVDNQSDELRLFDIHTSTIVASLQGSSSPVSGDCAMSEDESVGFSSHANRSIAVYELLSRSGSKDIDISNINISNAGVDMSLSPDGSLLVSVGAGNVYEPLSVIDTQRRAEIATAELFLDHTSAEFCDDGTLLVTTTFGHSHTRPFDNAVYDARVSQDGELQLAGNRLSSGAQPNNASCAPGSRAGVLLDREGGLTSFTLPGLEKADFAELQGATAVAAVFNLTGDRLYVRTSTEVVAFDYNPLNGVMKQDWAQPVAFSAEYFGIDQIAVDLDNGQVYVDGGQSLLILEPEQGTQLGAIQTGDATGVCFAQRQRRTPIVDMAANDLSADTVLTEAALADPTPTGSAP